MNSIIIMSNKFTTVIPIRLMHRIDYDERYPRLDRMNRIVTIPERVLGDKIIILDKSAIVWEKELFDNGETIDIDVRTAKEPFKADITIRSVNKIRHLDPSLIKILEVKE